MKVKFTKFLLFTLTFFVVNACSGPDSSVVELSARIHSDSLKIDKLTREAESSLKANQLKLDSLQAWVDTLEKAALVQKTAVVKKVRKAGGQLVWIGGKSTSKVWWVDPNNVLHWVKNPKAIKKYWSWSEVKEVEVNVFAMFPVGANITGNVHPKDVMYKKWSMLPTKANTGKLVWIGGRSAAKVWWIAPNNVIHWCTSETILKKYWSWNMVKEVDKTAYKDLPVGRNIE